MTWALVALLGYFFNAVAAVFDKYLLSDRIPAPAVYAFFVSLFSLFALGFIPFGFHLVDARTLGILLFSGFLFVYGLLAFYGAVKQHEVSRVSPLVGTVISLVAFLMVFIPGMPGEVHLNIWYGSALFLLILGGLLISFDLPLRRGEHISLLVLVAGICLGFSILLLKNGYETSGFVSGLVWSRLGMTLAGLSLLLFPPFREQIFSQFRAPHQSKRAGSTGVLFVVNKSVAGIAAFLLSYATYLGPVSFVQALSGMQYVFLLLMMFPLSFRYPQVFGERLFFWDWFQKIVAVLIIGLGLFLATRSGIPLFLM
jgi:uncharacterized membrane protein